MTFHKPIYKQREMNTALPRHSSPASPSADDLPDIVFVMEMGRPDEAPACLRSNLEKHLCLRISLFTLSS